MAYKILGTQAGLALGEAAVRLAGGEKVAVAVRSERNDNGSGQTFFVVARWIGDDGATLIGNDGKPVVIESSHNIPADWIAKHGTDAYAREVLLAALGEEPDVHIDVPTDQAAAVVSAKGAAATLPAGTAADATKKRAPIFDMHRQDRTTGSIAQAVGTARKVGRHNAASLL